MEVQADSVCGAADLCWVHAMAPHALPDPTTPIGNRTFAVHGLQGGIG